MKVVILGGGVAGFTCARQIRIKDSNCQITVIERQKEPYQRYLLYRWLCGKVADEDFFLDWEVVGKNTEIINDEAIKVNLEKKLVYLKSNPACSFDKAVLATGLKAEQFGFRGEKKKGVYYLANSTQLRQLKEEIKINKHILVYISSMFGLEFVTLLARFSDKIINAVCYSTLGFIRDSQGVDLRKYLDNHNIGLYIGVNIEEVFGEGRARATKLSNNKILASDLVLIDSPLMPWRLEVNNSPEDILEKAKGISCGLFACGDVLNVKKTESHFFFLNRLEARKQAI